MDKFGLKLILHFFCITGFIIGYGLLFALSIPSLIELNKSAIINDLTYRFITAIMIVTPILIMVYWVYSLSTVRKCNKCGTIIN